MTEAERKRRLALEAAGGPLLATTPATVRWLLCGRGPPVEACSADYAVLLDGDRALVLYADIEQSRVSTEERLEELGYEAVPYAWFEGPGRFDGAVSDGELEDRIAPLRQCLCEEERTRYRSGGADAAAATVAALERLRPELTELEAGAELSRELRSRGFVPRVVLVAGEERQPLHRHPLPTRALLGRHALLALTAEREGLFVSLTRLVSFGPPPAGLERVTRAAAEVDAAVIAASQPGATLGELFETIAESYSAQGFPDEWHRHHQGGLTGYKGREVFAVPGEPTALPDSCALAWNPSVTGGGKSEDTVLVTADGPEVITRTPELPELETALGLARAAIVEL